MELAVGVALHLRHGYKQMSNHLSRYSTDDGLSSVPVINASHTHCVLDEPGSSSNVTMVRANDHDGNVEACIRQISRGRDFGR